MFVIDFIRRLPRWFAESGSRTPAKEHPSSFTATLCRERARADRTGGEFSVVTFSVSGNASHDELLGEIVQHLSTRARMIDEYGWTEDGDLWLLLFQCPADAARIVAQDICERFSATAAVTYDLYHYAGRSRNSRKANGSQSESNLLDEPEFVGSAVGSGRLSAGSSAAEHQAVEPLVARSLPRSKRAFDVLVAGAALIAFAPVMAISAVLIKLSSPGPIFFAQPRTGRAGKPFRMYKFRTMVVDAEKLKMGLMNQNQQDGPAFKIKNDPRITRVGRILRSTGIDELPQLWNVLRGEMSIVGPRPLPISEAAACAPWQQERLDITPGLTCWWQVSDRFASVTFAEWMRMDIRYARRRSLITDLKLILRTVAFVIRRKGT